jgi:hypothetical protein
MRMHDRSRANPVQIKVGLARRTTVRLTKIMVLLEWQKKNYEAATPRDALKLNQLEFSRKSTRSSETLTGSFQETHRLLKSVAFGSPCLHCIR